MSKPILFLDHAPALGGAERSLLLLLKHLDRSRWRPHLACAGGPLAEQASALGIPVHTLPMSRLRRSPRAPLTWLTTAQSIARLAQQTGATLLIANTVRAALYAAPAAHLAHIPFVWHMRDFWLGESHPRHLWADTLGRRLLCASASRVIANSHATAAHIPCHGKVEVIHNGIEVADFDPNMDGTQFRREHAVPESAPLVGTVGRLRPWKGQDRFLRVFARVLEAVPDAWGVVVGGAVFGVEDGYEERLHRLADELGVAGRVVFTGHLANVRPALAALDLFVHPGDPEPFGLVNVEAMAMAKPVVAFAHGALPEIVVDGETGLLVPAVDENALSEAVIALLRDPTRRVAMGLAGRRRVEQQFAIADAVRGVEATLDAVLDKGS